MSYAFISALKANPQQSYVQLLNSIRDVLEEKYTQLPQLSSSHPIGKPCALRPAPSYGGPFCYVADTGQIPISCT